jgi:hypothetical protein
MVTARSAVKVLDFGLAKHLSEEIAENDGSTEGLPETESMTVSIPGVVPKIQSSKTAGMLGKRKIGLRKEPSEPKSGIASNQPLGVRLHRPCESQPCRHRPQLLGSRARSIS